MTEVQNREIKFNEHLVLYYFDYFMNFFIPRVAMVAMILLNLRKLPDIK